MLSENYPAIIIPTADIIAKVISAGEGCVTLDAYPNYEKGDIVALKQSPYALDHDAHAYAKITSIMAAPVGSKHKYIAFFKTVPHMYPEQRSLK